MSGLTLSKLCKRFGSISAVKDLSIQVADGQRLVILGPSGCGKTTTLRMIAGLEKPDSGSIRLGQRDLGSLVPARRDVAMIFQDAALYPHLSIRENLAFALRAGRLAAAEIEARIRDTADAFELADLLDRYPRSLSGGQQSRVALARGIVKRPLLLLLDEPLSGLDPPLRWQLQNHLLAWHRRHPTTTIHVTHDQQEAMLMGDLVAVMRAGVIEQVATPAELYRQPANRFVASFIGSPGMNFVAADVSAGALNIDTITLKLPESLHVADGPVDVGVRPEAIDLVSEEDLAAADAGRIIIGGVVESLRPTGAKWLVGVAWSGNLWWATCADEHPFSLSQRVRMRIDPADLYCFASSGGVFLGVGAVRTRSEISSAFSSLAPAPRSGNSGGRGQGEGLIKQ